MTCAFSRQQNIRVPPFLLCRLLKSQSATFPFERGSEVLACNLITEKQRVSIKSM